MTPMPNPLESRSSTVLPWTGFGLACLLFGWLWLGYWDFWLDDAFITFRYARNLAEGLGPVYNPGERAEGYTSALWMLLTALPLSAPGGDGPALAAIKLSGLALGVWILFRCFTFPGSAGGSVRRWPVILLAADATFVANCGDGMETPLFMALALEWARALLRTPRGGSGLAAGLLTAALVWTRPEALPLLLLTPALVLATHGAGSPARLWLRGFAAAGVLPVTAHVAWRWHYYGLPLPTTYYAKASGALLPRLQSGLADLAHFGLGQHSGIPLALWLALGLAAAGLWLARGQRSSRVRTWYGALLGLIVFRVGFDVWAGSEAMGAYRFLAPALPPLFILADEGGRAIAGRLRAGRPAAALVAAGAALVLVLQISGHYERHRGRSAYQRGMENAHIALGHWLAERHPEHAVVAIGDAGAVPFFSRLGAIDLWGLNDATIAQLPGEYGDRPGTASYVLGRHPEVIVLWNLASFVAERPQGQIAGAQAFDRDLAAHPEFQRDYRFVRELTFRPRRGRLGGYYLDVFERR